MHLAASMPQRFAKPSARIGQRLALLWLVVALLFQGLVTQTHAHFGADPYSTVTASARTAAGAVDGRSDGPATPACPLCEEKALFGAYLLTGSITIAAPIESVYHYVAASLSLLQFRASSHAWQSRAPPSFTI